MLLAWFKCRRLFDGIWDEIESCEKFSVNSHNLAAGQSTIVLAVQVYWFTTEGRCSEGNRVRETNHSVWLSMRIFLSPPKTVLTAHNWCLWLEYSVPPVCSESWSMVIVQCQEHWQLKPRFYSQQWLFTFLHPINMCFGECGHFIH